MEYSELLSKFFMAMGYLAVIILSINILLILLNSKNFGTPFRRLLYFLIFSLGIEIASRLYYFVFSGSNNLPLLHIYTLGEFILLSWFYKSLIKRPIKFGKWFWQFVGSVVILILLNSILVQSIFEFNTIAKTIVQIIIISYAVIYFYNLTDDQPLSRTSEKSIRLINSAILIYYSGSLFVFMCSQLSFLNEDVYLLFWTFNAILNVIFQLLILIGIWKVIFLKTPLSS